MREKLTTTEGFSRLKTKAKFLAGLGKQFNVLFFPFNISETEQMACVQPEIDILVVDSNIDDAPMTTNLVRASRYAGKRVLKTKAADALLYLKARQKFGSSSPIFILIDLASPNASALDFIQKLKADDQLNKIPVCVLTSSTDKEDIQNAIDLKLLGYMVKATDLTRCHQLSQALDQLLLQLLSLPVPDGAALPQTSFEIATNGLPSAMPNSESFANTIR
jgi:CheY-like chemotaxis protein